MKLSIRTKYTCILVSVMAGVIAVICLINHQFLADYYQKDKLVKMDIARNLIESYLTGTEQEAAEKKLYNICSKAGINAVVRVDYGSFYVDVFSTMDGESGASARLMDLILGRLAVGSAEDTVLARGENYLTCLVTDARTGTGQIDCLGTCTVAAGEGAGKYYYVLTTPLESIDEMAAISNRFLIIIGVSAIIAGAIIVYFVSGRMTRPIVSLTHLSRRMAELDFESRFEGHSGDELQALGENMNEMALRLESAIEKLQTANRQLEEDLREKENRDRLRREFLSNVSHELKTPIALVRGYAEGLRDGISEDEESRQEYCEIIIDEAEKMGRLVRQLLNLDELESGYLRPEPELFDLSELLTGSAGAVRLQAEEKNARIVQDIPPQMPIVADEFMIEQVVQNYLSNALHHVSEGGSIQISACLRGARVRLTVFNTGEKIPEQSLPGIWDKFYKVDKARTRAYGGSGIGLSIVKAIMEAMGGECGAENREDGVLFYAEWENLTENTERSLTEGSAEGLTKG